MTDNRRYQYVSNSVTQRSEYQTISRWVPAHSQVIDLACGDGSLLELLVQKKGVTGEGLELSSSGVKAAFNKGLRVRRGRIDIRLPYRDKQFDYAICNVSLQMVLYPEKTLSEMIRISRRQIISFPNFAFLPNRLELLFAGKMPQTMLVGHTWYNTGFIHQFSNNDFLDYCRTNHLQIIKQQHQYPPRFLFLPQSILRNFPSLFVHTAIYMIQSK